MEASAPMLQDLLNAIKENQRLQVTVWDPADDSVEHTFSSYVIQAGGTMVLVAPPSGRQAETITTLMQKGIAVGVVLETYPNPYIFYPVVQAVQDSPVTGYWLKIPENTDIEVLKRRRHVRIPMSVPLEVEYIIGNRWLTMKGRTEDVSGGGLRFTCSKLFAKEQDLRLRLQFGSQEPLMILKAKVIVSMENRVKLRPEELYSTACQFYDLDDAHEMMIVRECFRRELESRH